MTPAVSAGRPREFHMTVLGRTLEHLGGQIYKRRDAAIAELVANCWDAGASKVDIRLPESTDYDSESSEITITDDGIGMTDGQVSVEGRQWGRKRRKR
jgi:hypothetical protein